MKKLFLATTNQGKVKEISECLRDLPVEITSLVTPPSLPPCIEDGQTFMENARKKALHYNRLTGLMTLADDSGLMVDALGGAPGVLSSRFAGEGATDADRIEKLLALLRNTAPADPSARFACALSIYEKYAEIFSVERYCEGKIIDPPRGAGGFGFDPIFFFPKKGKTFAELSRSEKNEISHRGKAIRHAKEFLAAMLS